MNYGHATAATRRQWPCHVRDPLGATDNANTIACTPRLIERHGLKFRFRIPPQTMSLGSMFRAMEEGREPHLMADYSIGQTSLEQVFNQFAAQQDEEKGHMAGMIADEGSAAATKPGAAASAANTSATAGRGNVESPLTATAGSSKPRS